MELANHITESVSAGDQYQEDIFKLIPALSTDTIHRRLI